MKVSKNSVHAFLYRFIFGNNYPNNLCPYFWKVVVSGILFPICGTIMLPLLIINELFRLIKKDKLVDDNYLNNGMFRGDQPLIIEGIMFNGLVCIIIGMITIFFTRNAFFTAGIVGWAITLILGIVYILSLRRKSRTRKPKRPNIIISFVKAKYNKYCPKLEWYEKEEKTSENT